MEWTPNAIEGRIVAGGNGDGNRIDQLDQPTDVIIDRQNNSLIIADWGNKRVVRWARQTNVHGQIIVSDIDCRGLALHEDGSLYVTDCAKDEVRRWKKGETQGTIVAGGNGRGRDLNQLHNPTCLSVTNDHTLYISDHDNHRVMKWMKDAKEGIVVTGGNDEGHLATQLSRPLGLIVDRFCQIYVADFGNHRVMRWSEGIQEGACIVGTDGKGEKANQLNSPIGLSMDNEGHLYVVEKENHRIGKFEIN